MALDPKLLEILACPQDKGPLLYFADEQSLYNPRLQRRYRVLDGDIPDLLIDDAETVDDAEHARLTKKAESRRHQARPSSSDDRLAQLPRRGRGPARAAGGARTKSRARCTPTRSRAATRSATSSCWAWAARASPATSSRPRSTTSCRYRSRCSSRSARPRSSVPRRSRSRCRTRATPKRRCRWRRARSRRARSSSRSRAAARLAELARDAGALHMSCPDGFLPRAAIGALVAPLLVTLFRIGLAPGAHANLVQRPGAARARGATSACPSVDGRREPGARARAPDRPHDPARLRRRRARRCRRVPLEVRREREREGARVLAPVPGARPQRDLRLGPARRRHPPADHARRAAPRLRAPAAAAALRRRRARSSTECVHQVLSVEAEGEGRLAQLLDLMYVGDWVSCYLALQNDVDPGPIDAIFDLKSRLAKLAVAHTERHARGPRARCSRHAAALGRCARASDRAPTSSRRTLPGFGAPVPDGFDATKEAYVDWLVARDRGDR